MPRQQTMTAEASDEAPLADVFGVRPVALRGKVVRVRMWGAREVSQDVPAILGRIYQRIREAGLSFKEAGAGREGAWVMDHLPLILSIAGRELWELLLFSTEGLSTAEDFDRSPADGGLTGEETLELIQVLFELNRGFFVRLWALAGGARVFAGLTSPPS